MKLKPGNHKAVRILLATNGTTVMTTTKGYDALNRLTNTVWIGMGVRMAS